MPESQTMYDVLIVGGGPAGATAGYLLSTLGYRVLIVDRACFPRPKLCGGLITHKTVQILESVLGETVGSLEAQNAIIYRSDHCEIFEKDQLVLRIDSVLPLHSLDRRLYDNILLRKAEDAGATVIQGDRVTRIDLNAMQVGTAKGRVLGAGYILGADGANSIVRRELFRAFKIDVQRWQRNMATAVQVSVDRARLPRSVDCPRVYSGFVNWGYAWAIPSKKQVRIGLVGLNRKNARNWSGLLQGFCSALGLRGSVAHRIRGHPIPYGNFVRQPSSGKVALIGDAAGLVDPVSGEGLFYAHKSAELVSQAIHRCATGGAQLGATYVDLLRSQVYPQLIRAKRARLLEFGPLARLGYYPKKAMLFMLRRRLPMLAHRVVTLGPRGSGDDGMQGERTP